jgi:hypothetical protein
LPSTMPLCRIGKSVILAKLSPEFSTPIKLARA